ncbi:carbon catabolite repressor protein 4 homolog 1-like isoform X1 [Lytechinus variegatus]|uniref:carbon catabolite repressor protein 4 homolog 1-like isoform X1 n=1 Tax=Lytechinus variegatus TaxID=7654 RepID=UPI001BB1DCE8|nr:carbon catabolite repressor protein 4 homolog 1-like isoform X1 [Lytechinus variegatus]XP_041455796.1 carbon catabolite repressor protein 4 homolog 1-like isoform X1 [Lytechinus variegatus]
MEPNNKVLPPNLRREWLFSPACCHGDESNEFTLMNYNILADCHFKEDWYPYCPQGFRKMSERHQALLQEIKHHDPDIVCLQEVGPDYFADQLNPEMYSLGYHGVYMKKVRGVMEGEATFYKKNRFEMTDQKGVVYNELAAKACEKANLSNDAQESVLSYIERDHLVLFTKLQDIKTKKTVCIGNTHLLFDDYKNIDVITLQASLAINAMIDFAGGVDQAHILCGDFNQEPHMTGYQLMHDGKLDTDGEQFIHQYPIKIGNERQSLLDVLPLCFKHNSVGLKSAYKTVAGEEIPFSDVDDYLGVEWSDVIKDPAEIIEPPPPKRPRKAFRTDPAKYGEKKYIAPLDYQWFDSHSLSCYGVLEMVDEREIFPLYACPNKYFPSDHLSVMSRYKFI